MKNKLILSFVFCLTVVFQTEAFSSKNNIKNIDQLKDSISTILEKYKVPGAGLALVHKDSLIWSGGVGYADVNNKVKVSERSIFRVGSITKTFVALGILKLVEEGKLSLEDKLIDIVPEIAFENPWAQTDPLKLVHILEHTAGFDDMHFNEFMSPDGKKLTAREALAINSSSRKVRWRPGTRAAYSNPGYAMAGYILEKYAGEMFESYLRKLILNPLQMQTASFQRNDLDQAKISKGYTIDGEKVTEAKYEEILFRWAGSLNASPLDIAKFNRLLLNKGKINESQLFKESSINRMETPITTLSAKRGLNLGYGLANYSSLKGDYKSYGHSGGITGFISRFRYIPEVGVGYVVLLNAVNSKAYNEISDLLVDFLTKDTEKPVKIGNVLKSISKQYIGYYENKSPRNQLFAGINGLFSGVKILQEGDTLFTQEFMADPKPLIPVSENLFRYKSRSGGHIMFTSTKEGNIAMINADGIGEYYEKGSGFLFNFVLYTFFASIILALVFIPVVLIWWILFLLKKVKRSSLYKDHLFMLLGIGFFILAVFAVTSVSLDSITELGEFGLRTMSFFVGTIAYVILILVGFIYLIKYFKTRVGFWKYYMILMYLANIELVILFYQWDIIGMRMWEW